MLRVAITVFCLAACAQPAAAIFRFDEIDRRSFRYNRDYFLNIFSYRQRLSHRWRFADSSLGYDITAGSLDNDDLYQLQRARVRVPLADFMHAGFAYEEWEDYDARYNRVELETVLRFARPAWSPGLLDTPLDTPRADGFFVGGLGAIKAEKEFADAGVTLGYGNEVAGLRVDVWAVDPFFNDKNSQGGEYRHASWNLRAMTYVNLLGGDVQVEGWVAGDPYLSLFLPTGGPAGEALVFRYEQLRAGLNLRWRIAHDLRFDLEAWGELTRKARRLPSDPTQHEDLTRDAFRAYATLEGDAAPLLGDWASGDDVWFVGWHLHLLDEETVQPFGPDDVTIGRGESYLEVGYVLSVPSPSEQMQVGIRAAVQAGFLSQREVRPLENRHRVSERGLAKAGLGLELEFLDGRAFAFGQFTYRFDDPQFGGGNVQVMLTF